MYKIKGCPTKGPAPSAGRFAASTGLNPSTARYYTCPGGQCQGSPRSVAEWEGKCNAPDPRQTTPGLA
jgi:hypothetical protein